MSCAVSTPHGPREKRAAFPLAFAIILGIMLAIALIMMPMAFRPEPPRRSSIARPILHPTPRATSTSSSRPSAPPSTPGVVPVALGEIQAEAAHG